MTTTAAVVEVIFGASKVFIFVIESFTIMRAPRSDRDAVTDKLVRSFVIPLL